MGSKKKSFPCRSGAYGVGTPHSQPTTSDEIPDELLMQQPTRSSRTGRDGAVSSGLNARRGSWSLSEDMCLLAIFREMMVANNNDNDNITRDQWEILVSRHNERTPGEKVDKHQIQCRIKTLKKLYSLNRALRSKRGWTWDDSKQMAVAPDAETWEELIEVSLRELHLFCWPYVSFSH